MISLLLVFAGCKEKSEPQFPPVVEQEVLAEKVAGEWHCTITGLNADIYLSLTQDMEFELYQKIGDGMHRLYKGTWSMDESAGTLSGIYSDGSPWGSSYKTIVSEDLNSMTLIPDKASEKEEHVYQRCTIPEEIKENSIPVVKSETSGHPVL